MQEGRLGKPFGEEMHRRGVLAGGRPISYARGLVHERQRGFERIAHSGSTAGYRAWLARYPGQKLAVAVLCNAGDASAPGLGEKVADLFLPATPPEPAYTPVGDPPTGLFRNLRTGEPLGIVAGPGGPNVIQGGPLVPLGPNRWRMGASELVFASPDAFEQRTPEGDGYPWRRETPYAPTAEQLAAYAGTYVSDEVPGRLEVAVRGGRLAVIRAPDAEAFMAPTYADVFVGPPGVFRFERDPAGRVVALHANNVRVRDMVYRRTP